MIIKTKVGVLEHEPRRLNGEDNDEICGATHLTEQGGVSKKTAGEFFEAFTTLAYKEAKNTLRSGHRKIGLGQSQSPCRPQSSDW
jgi:hypothetical protein